MKSFPFHPALLAALLPFASLASASAQTASPTATTIPASKPATETATPSPGAAVNTSTPAEKPVVSKEALEKSDKNRDARKAERLQKYDKNHDGKLDKSERADMRADRAKDKKGSADKEKTSPTP